VSDLTTVCGRLTNALEERYIYQAPFCPAEEWMELLARAALEHLAAELQILDPATTAEAIAALFKNESQEVATLHPPALRRPDPPGEA
jgi:hypothetical protein